jgi:hypothetical protein
MLREELFEQRIIILQFRYLCILYPVQKSENTAVGIRHADHVAPSIRKKLALTSPTSGDRSVSIVLSRTQATEFF